MKFSVGLILGLLVGCASTISGMLSFQDREFLVHPDFPGLGYPYKETVCVPRRGLGRVLGKKCHEEQRIDTYDFNDVTVRKKFIDAKVTCKSAARFKY